MDVILVKVNDLNNVEEALKDTLNLENVKSVVEEEMGLNDIVDKVKVEPGRVKKILEPDIKIEKNAKVILDMTKKVQDLG